nr:hypothetical protein BaRGS_024987 [Batillaria attramentaria]
MRKLADTNPERCAPAPVYGWKGFTGDLCLQSYPILSSHHIRSIAAGGGHVLFLTTEGQVFGRGHNAHGQLGLGEEFMGHAQAEPKLITALAGSLDKVLVPTRVKVAIQEGFCEHGVPRPEIPVAIESVACGATHTLALSVEDEIWTWGCGQQLGLEDLLHAPIPRRIDSLAGRRVLMVVCGDSHSLALVQKVERTPKSHPSPARHRNVSKEAIVTQKLFPSLCARCNQEIYTYTDENDTCIISTDHVCRVDESSTSFDSSMIFSDDELSSSFTHQLASQRLSPQKVSRVMVKVVMVTVVMVMAVILTHSKVKRKQKGRLYQAKDVAGGTSKPTVDRTSSVESDGDVWKRQSASEEKVTPHFEEKVTSMDRAASPPVMSPPSRSRTPSSGSVASVTKLKGLVDENQAREFLTRQLEGDAPSKAAETSPVRTPVSSPESSPRKSSASATSRAEESPKKDVSRREGSPKKDATPRGEASSWKSWYPSSMVETMKTVTSKALTNIQTTMDSLVGQQNMELGDMSDANPPPSADLTFMRGCCVWDLAAGTNHSIFLADSSSMKPDVFYCGKQPGAVYELASSERAFYQELVKINTTLLKPLTKSSFFTVTDVFPYKSCLNNLVAGFISLTRKIGEGVIDLTEVVREDQGLMSANFVRSYTSYIEEFRRYSRFFADFLAIGGFEYCTRTGSEFFDKYQSRESPARTGEEKSEQKVEKSMGRFRSSMQFPFFRLKEYSRLLQKIAESLQLNSDASNLLQKAAVSWDSLKLTVTSDHKLADTTRAFWDGANPRLADALRIPSRRVMRDSKTLPLMMPAAGRFSTHLFILFNDMFVHLQAEWLMAFNSAINKVLSSQKEVGRRGSAERLSPPLVRHATHTFTRHPTWKDGTYVGTWLSGKMHGQHGVMVVPRGGTSKEIQDGNWRDGKLNGTGHIRYANGDDYRGYFKNGQRFGHGVFQQGRHLSSSASIYVGEWLMDRRQGYGVQDDILKGEKYMGMWVEDHRHGNGIIVTLDGMYFEGNFYIDKLAGFGLMLTDDNSCYEGEFMDITQLSGKGTLTLPTGDQLEGTFNGSWNEGLKISGTFIKCTNNLPDRKFPLSHGIQSKYYGKLSVPADKKWADIFLHCCASLGHGEGRSVTSKAWEMVAVAVSSGKKQLKELQKT